MMGKIPDLLRGYISQHQKNRVLTLFPETHNGKYILVSFLTIPFTSKERLSSHTHTNLIECKTVVDFFIHKGYVVDIINWNNSGFIPNRKYSAIFDIHSNIDRLSNRFPDETIKILYATGAHWLVQNSAEYQRLNDLRIRRGVSLVPRRQTPPCQSTEKSDHIIILGNQFAYQSFQYAKKKVHTVNLFSIASIEWDGNKNFNNVKNNFLWIGNEGMVHKGLDLVLEAFSGLPMHHLYICGDVAHETDFEREYRNELYYTPNIHTIGWTDIHTSGFRDLLNSCVGLVYPSCSEGQSGSVITCMNGGLIPIISQYCGVGDRDSAVILADCSVEEIRKSVREISLMDEEELKAKARYSWKYVKETHTIENYRLQMNSVLDSILSADDKI